MSVKVLIAERNGSEVETPEEINPSADLLATKGLDFENLGTHLLQKIGHIVGVLEPDFSIKPTYLGNGDVDFVEIFKTSTQTTANRAAKSTLTYSSGDVTQETLQIFDPANGTTVLKIITSAFTYTSGDVTKIEVSTT